MRRRFEPFWPNRIFRRLYPIRCSIPTSNSPPRNSLALKKLRLRQQFNHRWETRWSLKGKSCLLLQKPYLRSPFSTFSTSFRSILVRIVRLQPFFRMGMAPVLQAFPPTNMPPPPVVNSATPPTFQTCASASLPDLSQPPPSLSSVSGSFLLVRLDVSYAYFLSSFQVNSVANAVPVPVNPACPPSYALAPPTGSLPSESGGETVSGGASTSFAAPASSAFVGAPPVAPYSQQLPPPTPEFIKTTLQGNLPPPAQDFSNQALTAPPAMTAAALLSASLRPCTSFQL